MSELKVNKISPKTACGTTTLGDSGDTFTIPSGVTITNNGTQTGFGRAGSVDWQTSIQTSSSFTAVNGQGFFIDTSGNAITANLPAGTAGSIVAFADYARNFGTNNLTVTPNGSQKIGGAAANAVLNVDGQASTFVYADDTKGWINVQNAEDTESGAEFMAATGGTVTTVCTNFKVHTFTGPGTFCVSSAGNSAGSNTIDYLVVAGGGGGGDGAGGSSNGGGGGGAGGYRESPGTASGSYTVSPLGAAPAAALVVTATGYPITIGAGGATNNPGSNTVLAASSTITSAGGGEGGSGSGSSITGCAGGSGGGANTNPGPGAAGNTPPVNPPQGNPGGAGLACKSGGGGGATAAGADAVPGSGGSGGAGATSSINGTPTTRAAGGNGGSAAGPAGTPQPANSGNGGPSGGHPGNAGGTGGSGIVIIRYKFQ